MTDNMRPEMAAHFNEITRMLAQCYEGDDPKVEGVLVLQTPDKMHIITANATDMTAHTLLEEAYALTSADLLASVPPKDLLN
jgi:hypothetical protein